MSSDENILNGIKSVVASKNKTLKVAEENNYPEKFKAFTMVHQLRMKTSRKQYKDIFDCLAEVSKSSLLMFNEIKENADPRTLIAIMSHFSETNSNQRREINRRLAELRKANLIIKLKKIEKMPSLISNIKEMGLTPEKFSYMINPYLIKPKNYKSHERNYRKARLLWHATKGEGYKVKEILNERQGD